MALAGCSARWTRASRLWLPLVLLKEFTNMFRAIPDNLAQLMEADLVGIAKAIEGYSIKSLLSNTHLGVPEGARLLH